MIPANLFAYGTLMCEDIMQKVAGAVFKRLPGTVNGFCRYAVTGETYPGLTPEAGGTVDGCIYRDVSAQAWQQLDLFEGEMYGKMHVPVICGDTTIPAFTYVVKPSFRHLFEKRQWNFSEFCRSGKELFMNRYGGFDRSTPYY